MRSVKPRGLLSLQQYSIIFARLFEIVWPQAFPPLRISMCIYIYICVLHVHIQREREREIKPGATAGFKLKRGKLIQSSKFIGWKSSRRATSLAGGGQSCQVGLTLSSAKVKLPSAYYSSHPGAIFFRNIRTIVKNRDLYFRS